MSHLFSLSAVFSLAVVASAGAQVDRSPSRDQLQAIAGLLAIEDARAPTQTQRDDLVRGLQHSNMDVARLAVRALGRLERPALLDVLIPQLLSPDSGVRAEAATAIGQALAGSDGDKSARTIQAIDALTAVLARETDFFARGAVSETLGRLPFTTIDRHRVVERLLVTNTRLTAAPSGLSADFMPGIAGAAKGLESLFRLHQKQAAPERATVERLRQLVSEPLPPSTTMSKSKDPPAGSVFEAERSAPVGSRRQTARGDVAAWKQADAAHRQRTRQLALQMLVTTRTADAATIKAARQGPPSLRRLAVTAIGQTEGLERADDLIAESARDDSDAVRYEAIRVYGPRRAATGCRLLFDALDDRSPHVTLLAIDLMDDRCPAEDTLRHLTGLVESHSSAGGALPVGPAKEAPVPMPPWNSGSRYSRLRKVGAWHAGAHAIVSLARVSADAARAVLPDFAKHDIWQVRMYAARAAAVLNDGDALETLATDDHDNVREAAIVALSRIRAHGADAVYLAALERPDYQLIRTAAAALEGTPLRDRTAKAVLQALERLTKQRRDTSRDPRVALLQRLREVGGPAHASEVSDYLTDFDPRVATLAGELLSMWTGDPHLAKPQPLPPPPPPTAEELAELERARVVLTMQGGGIITLRLLPREAPLAAIRFTRLARAGYYNGLTFHRVAPNFVIQGGSPGANEYMGDGPYMRDEVGATSHEEGTVGVSTRGRDTGDAQIFLNLIDNVRLDHDYTVFALLERGHFTLCDILEGDVIERIDIRTQ